MMCTKTFKTYTNSRFISKVNVTHFQNHCQCGFCSECIRQKKSEWALRAYYQAVECFENGGFCLFDTLTYRDSELHWFREVYPQLQYEWFDFMRFSRDDVKKFFKRLRVHLERDGYEVGDNLKYLLTSEYGSELKTNRPHYHVLFYVNFRIAPELFSKYISEAWIHGITDGVMPRNSVEPWYAYKSKRYVLENRVFDSVSYDLNKLVNYVVKYITKDLFVYKKLYKRVYAAYTYLQPNWCQYYFKRLGFRRFKNNVLPFHLQSKGFGLYALKKIDVDKISRLNSIPLPFQNKGLVAFIPLCNYFKRKLFYQVGYFEGKLRWFLNEDGKKWKKKQLLKSIDNYASRLAGWREDIDSTGLARYHFLRRGVLCPQFMRDISDDDLLVEHLSCVNLRKLYEHGDLYYNYNTPIYKFLGGSFVSDRYHSELLPNEFSSWCVSQNGFILKNPDLILLDDVEKNSILESFESWLSSVGESKDIIQEQRDYQLFRYKELGML